MDLKGVVVGEEAHKFNRHKHEQNATQTLQSVEASTMTSLTPMDKAEEVSSLAMNNGLINGAMTLIPAFGALQLALRNPTFRMVCVFLDWPSLLLSRNYSHSFRLSDGSIVLLDDNDDMGGWH